MKYYIDTWSRVDVPPVCQLRRASDKKVLAELERGDIRELFQIGWRPPARISRFIVWETPRMDQHRRGRAKFV